MKFAVFVHPIRPKVRKEKIERLVRSLGLQISQSNPDMALVIGGDGTFSYYGRKLPIPMLFVGVPTEDILGSKSRLAEISLRNLTEALQSLVKGNYTVTNKRMLELRYGDFPATNVLTDVYLERGVFAGCIRYSVSVTNKRDGKDIKPLFTDFVIGNGVIISTSFGSSGYYSYLNRIRNPMKKPAELFNDNKLGICHILPTFSVRSKKDGVDPNEITPIRYTVPWNCTIDITVVRDGNIRLYGTTIHSKGIRIKWKEIITVTSSSSKVAKIIRLI